MAHHTMTDCEWALLLFLSLLWGASFLFIGIAVEDGSPLTLVTAILLGWQVLSEYLMPQHFMGMALIGAGLMAIDGRLFQWVASVGRKNA